MLVKTIEVTKKEKSNFEQIRTKSKGCKDSKGFFEIIQEKVIESNNGSKLSSRDSHRIANNISRNLSRNRSKLSQNNKAIQLDELN